MVTIGICGIFAVIIAIMYLAIKPIKELPSPVIDNAYIFGPTTREAEQNLDDFADTISQGPKYQERQRIEKLKSLAMLFEPLQPEYVTVIIDKKYLGKWGK